MPFQGGSRVNLASIDATLAHFGTLTVDNEPLNVNGKAVILAGDARLTDARPPTVHNNSAHNPDYAVILASSGGIQDDSGVQRYFASGLSFSEVFTFNVFTKDAFNNMVPFWTPPKAITPSNGIFYWNNGDVSLGAIVYVRVVVTGS